MSRLGLLALGLITAFGLFGQPDPSDVLTRHGTTLYLNGRAVHPVGVNAYELPTWWGRNAGLGTDE